MPPSSCCRRPVTPGVTIGPFWSASRRSGASSRWTGRASAAPRSLPRRTSTIARGLTPRCSPIGSTRSAWRGWCSSATLLAARPPCAMPPPLPHPSPGPRARPSAPPPSPPWMRAAHPRPLPARTPPPLRWCCRKLATCRFCSSASASTPSLPVCSTPLRSTPRKRRNAEQPESWSFLWCVLWPHTSQRLFARFGLVEATACPHTVGRRVAALDNSHCPPIAGKLRFDLGTAGGAELITQSRIHLAEPRLVLPPPVHPPPPSPHTVIHPV